MMSSVTQQWSDDKLVKSLINEVLPRLIIHTDSAEAIAGKINSLLASLAITSHHLIASTPPTNPERLFPTSKSDRPSPPTKSDRLFSKN